MIRTLLTSTALALVAACATPVPAAGPAEFIAATRLEPDPPLAAEIIETAIPLPLPGQMKALDGAPDAPRRKPVSPAKAIAQGRAGALIEPSVDGFVNAVQVYPYTEGALYRLYASPGQVTDIALEAGETLVSVSAGDTVRWIVGDTSSGEGESTRAHILVKPVSAGIRTNLMIATNRRTYHLELEATGAAYMAALSWRYPQDELASLTARNADARFVSDATAGKSLDLAALNFSYRITGDTPDWRPVRVFDDGRQVFIQMPPGIAATDLPPLFVLGETGKAELVNYRVRGGYYVVDLLFDTAELRLGTGRQQVVRIRRTPEPGGLASLFGSRTR